MEPTDYTTALAYINHAESLFAQVLRNILAALEDNKVDPLEYIMMGITSSNAGLAAYGLFRALPPAERANLVYVLTHGRRTWSLEGP